ncbi:MAG: Rieske 2Fe-2S domain-containing protein [Chitinivibrionales bacterium]|nr:Rieske 2Fe-2S domain-containing protein [Chitinivibrionales bacterium]
MRKCTRRDFCLCTAKAAVTVNALSIFTSAGVSSHTLELDLNDQQYQPLTTVGGAQYVPFEGNFRPLIVVRSGENDVRAFSSQCTHQGCQVNLPQDGIVECPCHGSRFTDTGELVSGPANADLQHYEAVIEGDTLIIGTDILPAERLRSGRTPLGKPIVTVVPGSRRLSIDLTGMPGDSDIEISTIRGKTVCTISGIRKRLSLDTGKFPSGNYLVRIKSRGQVFESRHFLGI